MRLGYAVHGTIWIAVYLLFILAPLFALLAGTWPPARDFWTERAVAHEEEITLTWYQIGEPLLIHTAPNQVPDRPYGVCTVLIPALGARLTRNGIIAAGHPWPRQREGRPFSTCALAFSESWTEAR